ncbi:hypothetical protein [Modestobacter sp. VKM Ac-2985]|uniref:hypothetical protein n=1 Tax=Modestobacter sp. VKM Ac-2985 TaxID=3004139 RepID=UPI0022ABAFF7|nr:hypothetical protein [Modestobacter sp. VKM Ac-2985]MCZ2839915.1 hypothetical protein [Modestobacter sp. VKM Ac-2985]
MQEPEIHEAARKHWVVDADMRYVFANPLRTLTEQGVWELTMHVGFTENGKLIEVGFVTASNGPVVILHAMPVNRQRARSKYGL